jgi:hypothetical protein
LSIQLSTIEQSALVDSGAVFKVIGISTLESIMRAYGIETMDKCQLLSVVYRFGTNGTPLETKFEEIIPWEVQYIKERNMTLIFGPICSGAISHFLLAAPPLQKWKILRPFPLQRKWEATAMDYASNLPLTASGKSGIAVVVDKLSRQAHF